MLSNIVFSTTYQCNAECKYCGAQCSPTQTAKLTFEDMKDIIDKVYTHGKLKIVVFTGGEPFLLGKDLLKAVEYCTGIGVFTRIVSNAYWATTYEKAVEYLSNLQKAGLGEINLSCDDYHQEFVPLDCVKNANKACKDLGITCLIGHKIMKDYKLTIDYLEEYFGEKLTMYDPKKENPKNNIVSTGFTVPVADDMHLIPDEEILYPQDGWHWMKACSSILQRIVITPDKKLSICCGMVPRKVEEMYFGTLDDYSIEELISQANNDLIVNWLALEGPYGIMKFIKSKDPGITFRDKYVNTCHLCSEILIRKDCREVLRKYGEEKAEEIMIQRALYDQMRNMEIPGMRESAAAAQ